MSEREQLLDELARCYARAAVDALLEERSEVAPGTPRQPIDPPERPT